MTIDDERTLEEFLNAEQPHTYFVLQVTGQKLSGKRCITIHRRGNEYHVISLIVDGNTLRQNPDFRKHWWQKGKKK